MAPSCGVIIILITSIVNLGWPRYYPSLPFPGTPTVTKFAILTEAERRRFDSLPRFNADAQAVHFTLDSEVLHILHNCHTQTSKAGFLLQLGYFRSHGKFYTADQFRQQDVNYIVNMLGLDVCRLNFNTYQKRTPTLHRRKILAYIGWKPLDQNVLENLYQYLLWHARNQYTPKQVFLTAAD